MSATSLEQDGRRRRPLAVLGVVFGIGLAIALIATIISSFLAQSGKPPRPTVQQIAILKPPPPPPPKVEERPPPPPMKKEEVKLPEPEKQPQPNEAKDEPPAGKNLGVDADGGPGGDSFGLVGRKGGRDLLSIGPEGGKGADRQRYAFFTQRLQQHLQDQLAREEQLRTRDYRAVVRIWLGPDGRVQRVELVDGTGHQETDAALRAALGRMPSLAEGPPEAMPQPVRLRITSRGAG